MIDKKTLPSFSNVSPLLIILLIVAAFAIGVLWTKVQYLEGKGGPFVAGTTTGNAPTGDTQQAQPPPAPVVGNIRAVDDSDHIRGNKDAKVTLVEYSDYECPFCKRFHPTMEQVMKEYDGKVRWVYRHFPLDQIHPRARPAALASECVANFGGNDKFWEYTDKLFEGSPESLTDEKLKSIAGELGVDIGKFSSCYSSKQFEAKVNADAQDGQAGGITGTPGTIIIDAKGSKQLIPGALPYESVKPMIDEALKS